MRAVKAIKEIYIFKLVDPAAKTENIVGCRREKGYRRLILPEERIDF
jgi:hypothetical protein